MRILRQSICCECHPSSSLVARVRFFSCLPKSRTKQFPGSLLRQWSYLTRFNLGRYQHRGHCRSKNVSRGHRVEPTCCDRKHDKNTAAQLSKDRLIILTSTILLTGLALVVVSLNQEDLADAIYGDGITSGLGSLKTPSGLGVGDLAASGLWALALYFCSPLQLLLLFLGRIETERPSDWVLRQLGTLTGQKVDDPSYSAPLLIRAPTVLIFAASGIAVAWAFQAGLGDGTWSISTGIGACMAAAVYEVGRPDRLNPEEAVELESQWQEFARFAEARLRRSGRCHESEIRAALKGEVRRFRSPDSLSSAALRDMIRNWHPSVDRTASGYYKNLSLQERVDPFTGELTGSAAVVRSSGRGESA